MTKKFDCPLFGHKKSPETCVSLRARRICKLDCAQYDTWASDNTDVIRATLEEKREVIFNHLRKNNIDSDDLFSSVVAKQNYLCDECKKEFESKKELNKHKYRKHERGD
jgi:hypothetical protein